VACWHIIKGDIMEVFQDLWSGDCRGLHAANQALVTLLAKHADAVEVRDLRPISLIHSVAKLVARVLSGPRPPHGGDCGTPSVRFHPWPLSS
jgi:mannosylglycoprotein endo-beta-mannosidase